ncbi:MAG: hypothetical protein FJ358_03020 [Thaumarchaeota archaeon]|nr:hypothetical protein [Nitrososphaerota archaeon]
MKTIYPIMGIMAVALILLLVLSYLLFTMIVPMPDLPGGILITSLVKAGVSGTLVLFWIFVLWQLTTLYMKRKVYKTR